MKKFKNKYRIPSARYDKHDYGSNGFYFITICTKNRVKYFGVIETDNGPSLAITPIGVIATQFWNEISNHFPFAKSDEFILMPEHLHGIIHINNPEHHGWKTNQFGIQSKNIPSIIRAYKSSVKRYANENKIPFEWQARYHDRVIRDEMELNRIRKYIRDNLINAL